MRVCCTLYIIMPECKSGETKSLSLDVKPSENDGKQI